MRIAALLALLFSVEAVAAENLVPPLVATTEAPAATPAAPRDPQATPVALPIRSQRKIGIAGEVGWNSISGLGVNLILRPTSPLALDLGTGISGVGYKASARARVNLLPSDWTPTLGLGLIYGSGSLGQLINLDRYFIQIEPSTFVQAVAGAEYCGPTGFTFLATFGYAHLLGGENVRVVAGTPTEVDRQTMDLAYGGGVVLSCAVGYSF